MRGRSKPSRSILCGNSTMTDYRKLALLDEPWFIAHMIEENITVKQMEDEDWYLYYLYFDSSDGPYSDAIEDALPFPVIQLAPSTWRLN